MIHAAAPHFLWPFAVGDASRFRVWGARAFVRDTTADKLSARTVPCVFLGFVPDAPGWQFYNPTLRRVFPSQDVTFDDSVPFYCLFPYRTAPLPPPPLFLTPGAPQVDPLPAPGPAPSGVSQVDPPPLTAPVEVTGDSGPAEGGPARGAASGGAEPGGAEPGGAERGDAEPGREESRGAEPGGTESRGAVPGGAEASGEQSPWSGRLRSRSAGTSPLPSRRRLPLSPQRLREWYVGHQGRTAGARGPAAGGAGAGDSATGVVSSGGSGAAKGAGARGCTAAEGASAGGSGVAAAWGSAAGGISADVTGARSGAGPGGARTGGTGAAGAGGSDLRHRGRRRGSSSLGGRGRRGHGGHARGGPGRGEDRGHCSRLYGGRRLGVRGLRAGTVAGMISTSTTLHSPCALASAD
ncbi:unnamed protein product [Closterium sp. NIES-54]